ncbi:MAG: iron ABC transporter permease [Candidatus Methanomethylophilaceae archaeon]|nr:iron ABC transporter permease [Candidatus Methanomethylophilaceae archaeon]
MKEDLFREIKEKNQLRTLIPAIILVVVVLIAAYSLTILSSTTVGFIEALNTFIDGLRGVQPKSFDEYYKMELIYRTNGPRAIGAILAGATLAVSGAVLQNIIRNPLADPYTLGISSGAMFGMVISVTMGICVVPFFADQDGMVVNAFVFALIPTAIIILVSMFKKVTPTMMILCGIAVMYVFNAFSTIIKYVVDPDTYAIIYTWTIGSLSGLSWESMPKMAMGVVLTFIPLWLMYRKINVVAIGDKEATTLGVDPNKTRIICLICISLGTALIVCYTGTIGFVGLVAPHIARAIVKSNCRYLIPTSATIGALMVLGADVLMRLIKPSLPVGVMLAIIGAPVFILILIRMKKSIW